MGSPARTRRVARLVSVLSERANGATVAQIIKATATSRATAYRDLALLKDAGYALDVETVNGESRYRLMVSALTTKTATPKELAALALARRSLTSVAGSASVRELDRLLSTGGTTAAADDPVRLAASHPQPDPNHIRVVDTAIRTGRKLRIRYRGDKDAQPRDRVVHPLELYVVDQQPYLIAWDEGRRANRTFKILRISKVSMLRLKSRPPDDARRPKDSKARAVKVWHGEPVDVRIRIAAEVARYVNEWPLVPNQVLEEGPGKSVDVCARVYGVEETLRWVLRWGAGAVVLQPPELRHRIRTELERTLKGYRAIRVSHTGESRSARER